TPTYTPTPTPTPLPSGWTECVMSASYTQFGSNGPGAGQFFNPEGIGVSRVNGNVYVVDNLNNRIERFDSSGNYLAQFGTSGSGNGQFNNPYGLAIDSGGNVYVSDIGNGRIEKLDSNGNYLASFPDFNAPIGLTFDS